MPRASSTAPPCRRGGTVGPFGARGTAGIAPLSSDLTISIEPEKSGPSTGPTITDMLDSFEPPPALNDLPLRFPVQDVYRFDERRIIGGRIEAGTLHVGDTLTFSPNNKISVVASIETWQGFHAAILRKPIQWSEGYIIPPTEPGLGVELNEEYIKGFPYGGTQLHLEMSAQPLP